MSPTAPHRSKRTQDQTAPEARPRTRGGDDWGSTGSGHRLQRERDVPGAIEGLPDRTRAVTAAANPDECG